MSLINPENQKIGDIILVYNTSSKANLVSQTIGTLEKAHYSHAILCLTSGTYIEAMKYKKSSNKLGIDIICLETLKERFSSEYHENWKVIRYKKLTTVNEEEILNRSQYYYGQNYNTQFLTRLFKKNSKIASSYCSELIARIYEDTGILIKNKRDIWPTHLSQLSNSEEWEDVSSLYKTKQSEFYDEKLHTNLCKVFRYSSRLLFDTTLLRKGLTDETNKIIRVFNKKASDPIRFANTDEFKEIYKKYIGDQTFYNKYIYPFKLFSSPAHSKPIQPKNNWVSELIEEEDFNTELGINTSISLVTYTTKPFFTLLTWFSEYMKYLIRYKENNESVFLICKEYGKALSENIPVDYNENDLLLSYESIDEIDETFEEKHEVKSNLYFIIEYYQFFKLIKPILTERTYNKSTCIDIIREISFILNNQDLLMNKKHGKSPKTEPDNSPDVE